VTLSSSEQLVALAALLTAIVGAATAFGAWLQRRKAQQSAREENEMTRLRADVVTAKADAAEAKAAHAACEERVEGIELRLETVEKHHSSLIPRWIKDPDKRVVWLNDKALMTLFAPLGYSRGQVLGHTFAELGLDSTSTTEIDRLDQVALMRKGEAASTMLTLRRIKPVPGACSELPPMVFVKTAGPGRENELIFEGIAFEPNDPGLSQEFGNARQAAQQGASSMRMGDEPGKSEGANG
jgi:hypothetical protein